VPSWNFEDAATDLRRAVNHHRVMRETRDEAKYNWQIA
jgi:hypothetical protein